MAERKVQRTLRGGMDPAEMARLSHQKRRERAEKAAGEEAELEAKLADVDVSSLPREALVQILLSSKTADYVRVQAANALAKLPDERAEDEWRSSPQVRADYVPPSWAEVLGLARSIGAFE